MKIEVVICHYPKLQCLPDKFIPKNKLARLVFMSVSYPFSLQVSNRIPSPSNMATKLSC